MKRIGFAFLIGVLRLCAVLPYGWVARVGHGLGLVLYAIPSRRRHIALTNLRLCFPNRTDAEYEALGRAHFAHVVRSYLERGVQWFGSEKAIRRLVQVESHIDLAADASVPTIFMGFHFVAIEVGCMQYSAGAPVASLYTRMSSQRMCDLAKRQRGRFGAQMIERGESARKVVSILRAGTPVMLAADMDQGIKNSVFVPFFDVPACTLTSVSRLAKLGRARVVPFITEVLPDYQGYKLTIFKPLEGFPSASEEEDARRMNEFLETQVRRLPEQYYWVHRRFKHRPEGLAPVY
ncbi:lipid A biosynthesis lauroyl acyltransferase [Pandoraea terrae]|uniref:Lipid A biosynthesis lauroyl acyltransferase n=1 Tax=Pandoraea terrae TaxID=1537710 RepID=A0A5E4TQR1_9BURK|nr:lipid A biosynthesis lauroyl acyltransferase [Pandoraea terrae]VVD90306.1 lipid A biosynthesis lauroyl acyltransferase [Pandoraea terrae]